MDREEQTLKILSAFKKRDSHAFAYIFKLHHKPLCYFAEKLLGEQQEAEDIVADSFMKLWAKHADFESFAAIKSFLYVTTRNACFNFLKYSKRVSASQKDYSYWSNNKEEEILHIMFKAELLAELSREIESLPKKCRNIFKLSFFDGLSTTEIAEKLGLSDQTVRNQKSKAVQLIKTAFFKRNLLAGFLIFLCSACYTFYF